MLAIGRALMAQPKILMLDEPLMGLSPVVQAMLVRAIREIGKQRGITMLVDRTVRPADHARSSTTAIYWKTGRPSWRAPARNFWTTRMSARLISGCDRAEAYV